MATTAGDVLLGYPGQQLAELRRHDPQETRSELRWLSEALGAARDPGVIHTRLDELLASEPEGLVLGPAARHIAEELDAEADFLKAWKKFHG